MDSELYRAPTAEGAPPDDARRAPDKGRPSRIAACLFAVFCGIGVGHFYAGLRQRALAWLGATAVAAFAAVFTVLLLAKAGAFGWALFVLFAALVGGWLAPLVDLWSIPRRRFSRVALWQLVAYVLGAQLASVALSFTLRTFLLEAFKMPSCSMAPALLIGDHLFVDKRLGGEAVRGDVIVFTHPEHAEEDYLKRVIGLPGDVIEMKDGHPMINGWQVPHCVLGRSSLPEDERGTSPSGVVALEFLDGRAYLTFSQEDYGLSEVGPWTVAAGECFVLGDFRTNSADSRVWFRGRGGGVPLENVKGRALGVWLSVQGKGADWSRTGVSLLEPSLPRSMLELKPALEKCLGARPNDVETVPPRTMLR